MGEIRLDQITKVFANFKAVNNVFLTIRKGELFSFLGPSGSGKTTILRMIAGFEVPTSGRIYMENKDITFLPPNKRQINTIFQHYSLFPHMTVFENVAFGLKIKKVAPKEIRDQVYEMLKAANIVALADKYPHQISGGEKQRVAIVRALINKPQVLLLDEPLAALDPKLRQRMLRELTTIHDEIGITFIYVTHNQDEAMSVSDKIALMKEGEIVQLGAPEDIWEHPNSLFSAHFIGDTNFLIGEVIALDRDYATIRCQADDYPFEVKSIFHIPLQIGQAITLSIRPERMSLSRQKPKDQTGLNVLKGYIEDILYLGTYTQYVVRTGSLEMRVLFFHKGVGFDEKPLDWDESVYVFWRTTDSYIINEPADESLRNYEPFRLRKKNAG